MSPQGECTCVHGRSLHCGGENCSCCTAGYYKVQSSGSCVKKGECTIHQYLDWETGQCLDW
jgi:hypothetical protein